jgi:tRNA(Ile)-lysidine synthase
MEKICAHEQLNYWEDPTNTDPTYLRNDIRHRLMPVLREVLGEQVSRALARTAALARADAAYLDEQAALALLEATRVSTEHECRLDLNVLRALPGPLRSRVLRQGISGLGAPSPDFERLSALDHLVRDSKSAGPIELEGQVLATRVAGPRLAAGESAFLRLRRPPAGSDI